MLGRNPAEEFFQRVLEQARRKDQGPSAPTDDPGNPTVNFRGEKRSNDTHEATTDPESRLARKSGGQEAKLSYCGNVPCRSRHWFTRCT